PITGLPGVSASNFGVPQLNDNGQVAFNLNLAGTGVVTSNNLAIYSGTPGALGVVARRGSQAPTFPAGVNFGPNAAAGPSGTWLSDDGRLAFVFNLTANAGQGISTANDSMSWIASPGGATTMLREGDPAPGVAGGTLSSISGSAGVFLNNGNFVEAQTF